MEQSEQFLEGTDRSLDQLNVHYVRALLNILTEAPFFYRNDDSDLFEYLRSHQDDFHQFFAHYFGWELYTDRRMARVMARRADSIWRAVTRSGSRALRPKAPKFSAVPPLATPL